MVMIKVSIQDLKGRLSAVVAEAEAGQTILITRHNDPVAQLGPAGTVHVHRGERVGTGRLESVLTRATKGRYLAILRDDRGSR
jgi:prevent-host-death family protein